VVELKPHIAYLPGLDQSEIMPSQERILLRDVHLDEPDAGNGAQPLDHLGGRQVSSGQVACLERRLVLNDII
jgi:hypothetical protein